MRTVEKGQYTIPVDDDGKPRLVRLVSVDKTKGPSEPFDEMVTASENTDTGEVSEGYGIPFASTIFAVMLGREEARDMMSEAISNTLTEAQAIVAREKMNEAMDAIDDETPAGMADYMVSLN
jgi:hypothetical protein